MTPPVLVVMWGVVAGVTVEVDTLEVQVLVDSGVVDGRPVDVGAPVEVADAGGAVGLEVGPVLGKGSPVVDPGVGVVFEEVGPGVGEPVKMEGAVRAEGVHASQRTGGPAANTRGQPPGGAARGVKASHPLPSSGPRGWMGCQAHGRWDE